MLLKDNLSGMKKVGVSVWNRDNSKMKDGKYSKTITVYDATADEVLEAVKKAIKARMQV